MDNKIIPLKNTPTEEPEAMTAGELRDYLEELYAQRRELDAREPREGTDAYDLWADRHEALEDTIDDVLDALDDMEGR